MTHLDPTPCRRLAPWALAPLLALLLAPAAPTQTWLLAISQTSGNPQGYNTQTPDAVGDVDGDGVGDLAITTFEGLTQADAHPVIRVHSGVDASTLLEVHGPANQPDIGLMTAGLGDANGDGVGDLVLLSRFTIAASPATNPTVYVVSGATGLLLYTLDLAVGPWEALRSVTALHDLDGDGVRDFAVGMYACGPGLGTHQYGRVEVRSGADGALIHTWCGDLDGDDFGAQVLDPGDLDGDGVGDVLVSATQDNVFTPGFDGYVRIYSGLSGLEILTVTSDVAGANPAWACSVDVLGDLDGDGRNDLLVGARQAVYPDNQWLGAALVYSGLDGHRLLEITGPEHYEQFGTVVAGPGDLDGDGTPDILVVDRPSAPQTPTLYAYSGADAGLLFTLDDPDPWNDGIDRGLEILGDVNGDTTPDFVTVAGETAPGGVGSISTVRVHSGRRLLFADVGGTLAGSLGPSSLVGEGSLRRALPLRVDLTGAVPGSPVWMVLGFTRADLPFAGGTLVPSPDKLVGPFPISLQGSLSVETALPETLPDGVEIYMQAWMSDASGPFGLSASNALLASQQVVHAPPD